MRHPFSYTLSTSYYWAELDVINTCLIYVRNEWRHHVMVELIVQRTHGRQTWWIGFTIIHTPSFVLRYDVVLLRPISCYHGNHYYSIHAHNLPFSGKSALYTRDQSKNLIYWNSIELILIICTRGTAGCVSESKEKRTCMVKDMSLLSQVGKWQ